MPVTTADGGFSSFTCDLLNAVAAPVLVLDPGGRLVFCNTAFCEVSRYSPEAVLGRSLVEVFLEEEDAQALTELLQGLNAQQPGRKFEGDWRDVEGVRHRWRWTFKAVFDESGRIRYVFGTEIDIASWGARAGSWHREDELSARHDTASCETRFTTVFDQLPISTTIFNPEGWILVGNQAALDLWGIDGNILQKEVPRYNIKEDKQFSELGVDHLIKKAFSGEAVEIPAVKYDPRNLDPNHSGARWVKAFLFPIKEHGKLLEIVLMLWDVTEQKLAEDALRKTHAELEDRVRHRTAELQNEILERQRAEQALFEEKERLVVTLRSIGDAVITADPAGRVRSLNPAAEALTGWVEAEAIGRPLAEVFDIVDEDTREPAADPVRRCIEQGRIHGLAGRTVLITRGGEERGIDDSASPIFGTQGGILGAVIVFRDVTQQRRFTRELSYHAQHDPLTGLVNRREFERRLAQTVVSAKKYGSHHVLCFLDLDQFKAVNDGAGHAAGDELLRQITALLMDGVRERDTVARLGGDEFGLLLANCPGDKAVVLTEALITAIRDHRFVWEGQAFHIGASIGIVPIGAHAPGAAELMRQADLACYSAKHGGRNRVYLWEEERSHAGGTWGLEELRAALHGNLVQIEYQRMVPLDTQRRLPDHYELYSRLLNAAGERTLPGAFIPAAERYRIMDRIDRWVTRAAVAEGARLLTAHEDSQLFINLSAATLADEDWLGFLLDTLADGPLSPRQLCFEIKEDLAAQLSARAARLFTALKDTGCRLALDDYGSGALSFSLLKRLPVDYLKMAPALTSNVTAQAADRAVVAAVRQVAEGHGALCCAKTVESGAALEVLRELGVDYAQGYALSPLHVLRMGADY